MEVGDRAAQHDQAVRSFAHYDGKSVGVFIRAVELGKYRLDIGLAGSRVVDLPG